MEVKTYIGKDNRVRYYYKDVNGNNHYGSYPRILMAEKLGRPLKPYEDVHHIDGNPLNNNLDNLEVINHGDHQRAHSTKYKDTIEKCVICGNSFLVSGHSWSRLLTAVRIGKSRTLTCSRSCAGKAGSGAYTFLYDSNKRFMEVENLVNESR